MNTIYNAEDWKKKANLEFMQTEGWFWETEGLLLAWYVSQLPDLACCVEIGSYKGRSAVCICSHLKAGGLLVSIDPFDMSNTEIKALGQAPDTTYPEFIENTKKYHDKIYVMTQPSYEAVKTVKVLNLGEGRYFEGLDLVLIDGDHSYEGVARDVQDWRPLIKPGGFLAFHDANQPAVIRAAVEAGGLKDVRIAGTLMIGECY